MNEIITGDCFEVLHEFDDETFHAVVTDPPYGLAFMGRSWDDFEPKEYQEWCEEWAREVQRVLKPGGHMLAFSGNRTHHRLFTGVEDAGFEIRDTVTWHYGSGFPKALDVSKAIDKAAGAKRDVIAEREAHDMTGGNYASVDSHGKTQTIKDTKPATDAAKRWDGFKTALKPATEYVVVARKPFSGTVAENVQAHGTGALNIDGTRITIDEPEELQGEWDAKSNGGTRDKYGDFADDNGGNYGEGKHDEGRYPSNVVFDETQADALDREVGECPSDGIDFSETTDTQSREKCGEYSGERTQSYQYEDNHNGPSRYFYTSKASRAERTLDGQIDNAHPTVKPQDLMEWLVKLVTAEGQSVLDPFAGSGTTCKAAKELGREFVGIEQDATHADTARARCGLTVDDPSNVRGETQAGLEQY